MIQHKLIIATNINDLQSRVDILTDDGWLVVVGSVGGMFSGTRNSKLIAWAILEKEVV